MNEKRNNSVQIFCIMILFAMLSLSALALVAGSIKSYKNVSINAQNSSQLRASLSYVTNKIRTFDKNGAVQIKSINGTDTLVITAVYDGDLYEMLLYFYDGYLKEQFILKGEKLDMAGGNSIAKIKSFTMDKETDSLFHFVALTENGDSAQAYINVSSYESREENV